MRQRMQTWVLPPLVIAGLVGLGYMLRLGHWGRVWNMVLAAAFLGWLAWLQRGRWRDVSISLVSITVGLAAIEAVAIKIQPGALEQMTPGYSVSDALLGWRPGAPGEYHHVKRRPSDKSLIFDVRYTIVPAHERKVEAGAADGSIVFLGDSMTFGTGVNDADTFPQAFSEATGRRLAIRNLAMSGYGPQQVLRLLESDQGQQLKGARALVFQTASFHAERSSCWASFVTRAPRYVLVEGVPVYQGKCYEDWWIALRGLFIASATYQKFINPLIGPPSRQEMELYIAMLIRTGQVAKERIGAPLVIVYLPRAGNYLSRSGMTEEEVMQRLRAGGLTVLDGRLDPAAFSGQPIAIPDDGHPTGTANRARAEILRAGIAALLPPSPSN